MPVLPASHEKVTSLMDAPSAAVPVPVRDLAPPPALAPPPRRRLTVAHRDDESLGFGGTLAKHAHEGIETSVVTARCGERGWFGDEREQPGLEALGRLREAELPAATPALGVHTRAFLDYVDGDLD